MQDMQSPETYTSETPTSEAPSPTSGIVTKRVRTVEGSCWSCKKRRIKCDLAKPLCMRCTKVGAMCNYNERLIKWSTKPTVTAPAMYQAIPRDQRLAASLAVYEKRALDYFHSRFWPLLTTASKPCTPPIYTALEHRVVLLATCVLADSHRVLQDGRNSQRTLQIKRLDCLAAVRGELDCCNADGDSTLTTLLLAVLLLYFHDGFLESTRESASTSSHHAGVRAIIERLGGINAVMNTGQEFLQMLLSEFASTDVTTAMLKDRLPIFTPTFWDDVDKTAVWWGRDPFGRFSLSSVFREMSSMIFYRDATLNKGEAFSMDQIRMYEAALRPVFAPLTIEDLDQPPAKGSGTGTNNAGDCLSDREAVHGYALIRAFQHTALIYLYRAVCGLPILHPLVQQHVLSCLDCIFEIKRPSKILNCIIFPLCVAGAHVQTARHQKTVLNMINLIYDEMRFASIQSVSTALNAIWKSDSEVKTWAELFADLSPHALVL